MTKQQTMTDAQLIDRHEILGGEDARLSLLHTSPSKLRLNSPTEIYWSELLEELADVERELIHRGVSF